MDSTGEDRAWELEDFGYGYRTSVVPPGMFWEQAILQGHRDDPAAIRARMAEITDRRQSTQPIKEKTGGSTFKNPQGHSAWRLVDEAGWRGRLLGGAMMSPLHANFMINAGEASAADLEALGEAVRADVAAKTGVELEWEIKRLGRDAAP
jgi:UDP-N-acetylmuramate dehydrogenase